ncbi:ribonuclease HI [Amphibacillus marinus]|uniref:Ribonuclease HI n=1 Tax=Amphibacillus marinus TaxID=872970 RepID=A0A1H8QI26_9BACI|nr:reverse transcriptase-like protein [Amphibacillus marinus]SEO53567.1 ribonuclease HI [Amphibacillus marinus]
MEVTLQFDYQAITGEQVSFKSAPIIADQALKIAADLIKTGRTQLINFEDEHGYSYNYKQLQKQIAVDKQRPQFVELYFDGGFNHETKESGLGIVIYYQQNDCHYRVRKNACLEQLQSNNEAEYAALAFGINELGHYQISHQSIKILGDSKVVINQLAGEWPCHDPKLNYWADQIEASLAQLNLKGQYKELNRKENNEADRLAGQALKGEAIESRFKINNE